MRGILFHFDNRTDLEARLDEGLGERELPLPREVMDVEHGQWIVAQICAGGEGTSVAGRVVSHGEELRCVFEDRDWLALERFAAGGGPPSLPPPRDSVPSQPLTAPPDTHVLIIDDDEDLRVVLSSLLEAAGFHTTAVSCAEDALEVLHARPIELVLLDWHLPGMSGLDFCACARRDPLLRQVPICFVSSLSCRSDVSAAFRAGASDYITKPFRAPELKARILGLLGRAASASLPPAVRAG